MINECSKKDIKYPKLTVAKDRVALKVPLNIDPDDLIRIVKFKDSIIADISKSCAIAQTLRGKFGSKKGTGEWYIYLSVEEGSKKNRKKVTKYKFFESDFNC